MAEEFQLGSGGGWWESSSSSSSTARNLNRYDHHQSSTAGSTTSTLNMNNSSFGWPTEIVDINNKARSSSSSMDSVPVSCTAAPTGLLPDPSFQMMDLTLSSQSMADWNQALFSRGEKSESSFRSMLQEEAQGQDQQWRHKIYSGSCEDSSNFQLDSSATTYANNSPPPTNVLQGLLVNQQPSSMNYSYANYGGINSVDQQQQQQQQQLMAAPPSWSPTSGSSNKFPQFLRTSPPKHPTPPPPHHHHHHQHHQGGGGQLHFSNNTPFWNASSMNSDGRSSLFPSLQSQISLPNFQDKPIKNTSEGRDIGSMAKKSGNETSSKRPRNETTPAAPMPAFKVRKEKMGDRITALQQLVSPFGKTDTASVLSEAIEYIKFLHEQVSNLSSPYMKSGAPMTMMTHQQNPEKTKDSGDGPKQDLRSRGLCLVPVSSTFPVTHETTVDFWTPRLGGTFRFRMMKRWERKMIRLFRERTGKANDGQARGKMM